jgi:hypothetical protein
MTDKRACTMLIGDLEAFVCIKVMEITTAKPRTRTI